MKVAVFALLILFVVVADAKLRVYRHRRALTTVHNTYGTIHTPGVPGVTTYNNLHGHTVVGPRVNTFGHNNLHTSGLGRVNHVNTHHNSAVGPHGALINRHSNIGGAGLGGTHGAITGHHINTLHG